VHKSGCKNIIIIIIIICRFNGSSGWPPMSASVGSNPSQTVAEGCFIFHLASLHLDLVQLI